MLEWQRRKSHNSQNLDVVNCEGMPLPPDLRLCVLNCFYAGILWWDLKQCSKIQGRAQFREIALFLLFVSIADQHLERKLEWISP